jgi:hypothetical protein
LTFLTEIVPTVLTFVVESVPTVLIFLLKSSYCFGDDSR